MNTCEKVVQTSSAPRLRTYSSFLPEAVAMTRQPLAFASWIAKEPTDVLPPLIKTVCPASRPPYLNNPCQADWPASGTPAASIGVSFSGRLAITSEGAIIYSASAPCFVFVERPNPHVNMLWKGSNGCVCTRIDMGNDNIACLPLGAVTIDNNSRTLVSSDSGTSSCKVR
jgi:hypothetical protein